MSSETMQDRRGTPTMHESEVSEGATTTERWFDSAEV